MTTPEWASICLDPVKRAERIAACIAHAEKIGGVWPKGPDDILQDPLMKLPRIAFLAMARGHLTCFRVRRPATLLDDMQGIIDGMNKDLERYGHEPATAQEVWEFPDVLFHDDPAIVLSPVPPSVRAQRRGEA